MALTRPTFNNILTNVVAFGDPITVLHSGATSANVDVGFLFNRANGLVSNVSLYWSESAQSFVTAFTSNSGATDSNISPSSYANLTIGNLLMVNGSILNVTGNINANTVGTHYGNVSATGNISTSGNVYASSFFYANGTPFTSSSYGNVQLLANLAASSNPVTFGSNIVAASGTASSSTTTGALVVTGGVGISGAVYAGSLYDNGVRVVSTSSGAGNLTISAGAITLPSTGPGVASVGGSTAIPVITTDAYGRVSTTSTAAVIAPAGTLSGSTLNSGVTASSLTSVGVLTGLTTTGTIIASTLNAATIGNSGATLNGTLAATNVSGTVATANVSLYDQFTNTSTNATFYPSFFDKLTGNGSQWTNSSLTYNPSTGALTATSFNGVGTFSTATTSGTLIASGNIVAASGTASTSTTSGALVATGGAGIAGNVYIGGVTNHTGNVAFDGQQVTHYDSIIDLHTYGNLAAWSTDDGKDIGLRLHYYNGADSLAFLGLENTSRSLQFLINATETNSNVSGTFGNVQFGSLLLSNSTTSGGTTSGALVVTGGMGITGDAYHGGNVVHTNRSYAMFTPTGSVNWIGLRAPSSVSANIIFNLPNLDGTAGQFLKTDGAGTLSFATASGGGASSGFAVSTITTHPAAAGNKSLGTGTDNVTEETPFASGGTDAFGVSLGIVYDQMEPTGTTVTVEMGSVVSI